MDNGLKSIFSRLPEHIENKIVSLPNDIICKFEELRIKCYTDTLVIANGREISLNDSDMVTPEVLEDTLNRLLNYSYYAYEDELSNGYITIEGGHRVGICGRVTLRDDKVHLIKEVSSLNIRRSREIIGAAKNVIPFIDDNGLSNTLIISPPKCGKTTILRDIARCLSNKGYRVGICDERSEIAGSYNGVSPYDLGPRTDVLDGCPKAQGIIMLIRSMSPDVIITDEIGKKDDAKAIEAALCSGIKIITSIHGNSYDDVLYSNIGSLLNNKIFETLIFLSSQPKTGTIKKVLKVSKNTEDDE